MFSHVAVTHLTSCDDNSSAESARRLAADKCLCEAVCRSLCSRDQRTDSANSPNEVKRSSWAVKTKSWMFKNTTFSLNSPRIILKQSALSVAFQSRPILNVLRAIKNLLWHFSLIKVAGGMWAVNIIIKWFGWIINLFLRETYSLGLMINLFTIYNNFNQCK